MRNLSECQFRVLALLLPVILTSGCMSTMAPKMPKELTSPSITSYSADQFSKDIAEYRQAVAGVPADLAKGTAAIPPDLAKAQALRNQISYQIGRASCRERV